MVYTAHFCYNLGMAYGFGCTALFLSPILGLFQHSRNEQRLSKAISTCRALISLILINVYAQHGKQKRNTKW